MKDLLKLFDCYWVWFTLGNIQLMFAISYLSISITCSMFLLCMFVVDFYIAYLSLKKSWNNSIDVGGNK